jgi:hypothetical protein
MGIVYLLRWISPLIIKYLFNRFLKKMGDLNPHESVNKKEKSPTKKENDMGEYIDYEEID